MRSICHWDVPGYEYNSNALGRIKLATDIHWDYDCSNLTTVAAKEELPKSGCKSY